MIQYENDIARLNTEVEKAKKDLATKDEQIADQSQRIAELDRKANPHRYRLTSGGAELVKVNVPNYNNPSLRIWTRVGGSHSDLPWDGKKNTGRKR